ncbi:MAG: DNA repair exonuclease [Eubacteriaceae bacterium]|nr:DNA repair exonuclease [Eubacteriaceae bacterium]
MKLIHASDFHLFSGFVSSPLPAEVAAKHRSRLYDSFSNIIKLCLRDKVDILLLSGDLFEAGYTKISDVKRIADAFAGIPETRVFISPGNHDYNDEDSLYRIVRFPSNVHIFRDKFEAVEIPELNTVVYGFGWKQNRYPEMPFSFVPLDKTKINLLCLHCDVISRSDYLPIDAELIESLGFDYAALGHIHKAGQVKKKVFYSGSPEPLNFGEDGNHGFFYANLDKKSIKVSFVPSAKCLFKTVIIKLTGKMDSNYIKEKILEAAEGGKDKNVYRVVFTGTVNPQINLDDVISDLKDEFYCLIYIDKSVFDYDIKKLYHQNKDNIIGKYIQKLMKAASQDPVMYSAMLKGLNALLYKYEEGENQ